MRLRRAPSPRNTKNKFGAESIVVDGVRYDSKGEYKRYHDLQIMERQGEIKELKLKPKYTIQEPFTMRGIDYSAVTYTADYAYMEKGKYITEDFKGEQTREFKRTMRLFIKLRTCEIFRISSKTGIKDY